MYFHTLFLQGFFFFQIKIFNEKNSQLQDESGILEKEGQLSDREIMKRKAEDRQKSKSTLFSKQCFCWTILY